MEVRVTTLPDTRPIPRIASVATAPKTILVVTWEDGHTDSVDLSGWISTGGTLLSPLLTTAFFARAAVAEYGLSVQWDEDGNAAIDSVHLEALRDQQRPFESRELGEWQRRMQVSNQEAADLLGVSQSTWLNYKGGKSRIPRAVQIACHATERDPIFFEAHYHPRSVGRPGNSTAA
jgi:hypothetical protein